MTENKNEIDSIIKLAKQQYNLDLSIEQAQEIQNKIIKAALDKLELEMIDGISKSIPVGIINR